MIGFGNISQLSLFRWSLHIYVIYFDKNNRHPCIKELTCLIYIYTYICKFLYTRVYIIFIPLLYETCKLDSDSDRVPLYTGVYYFHPNKYIYIYIYMRHISSFIHGCLLFHPNKFKAFNWLGTCESYHVAGELLSVPISKGHFIMNYAK